MYTQTPFIILTDPEMALSLAPEVYKMPSSVLDLVLASKLIGYSRLTGILPALAVANLHRVPLASVGAGT